MKNYIVETETQKISFSAENITEAHRYVREELGITEPHLLNPTACFECGDEWDEEYMIEVDALEEAFLCTPCFEIAEIEGDKEARRMNLDYIREAL